MRHLFFCLVGLTFLTLPATAESPAQNIDLTQPSERYVIEEEYQSIRPGAMDEKFRRDKPLGDTEINLSYDEDQPERDEYGVIREIEGPATTDYSKPPETNSNN